MAATPARTIIHADMDAFYASIEQRDHPELRGRPVIVGAGSARGVVAAASYEARTFGVRSAMPGFQAKKLCPEGVFVPANLELYGRVSAQVHQVFEEFTPEIEPIALDEAFLDVSGSLSLFGDAETLARSIKRRVLEATGLVVSVGVASNKLVAKIACRVGKPDGLRIVAHGREAELLDPLPIRYLWGVGPVLGDKLEAAGIGTVGALARANADDLARLAGERAPYFIALARGEDRRGVESSRAPKSIGEESTFERDVSSRARIFDAIVAHAEEVARRLRRSGYRARCITLKIKLARARAPREGSGRASAEREPDYPLLTRQRRLKRATNEATVIADVARALWDLAAVGQAVRLIGVSVSSLQEQAKEQLELFAPRRPDVGGALDAIRDRFGHGVIQRAVEVAPKVTPSLRRKRGD